jgi:dCTP deaminase
MLSDGQIRFRRSMGDLQFSPDVEDRQIQPASVDLRLGHEVVSLVHVDHTIIDSRDVGGTMSVSAFTLEEDESLVIHPGEFCLAQTLERVTIPATTLAVPYEAPTYPDRLGSRERHTEYRYYPPLVGQVVGRSSLARLGIMVEMAGLVDPGFEGHVTLELSNVGNCSVRLYPGDRICQLVLFECGPVERPYGHDALESAYQHQEGATPSRGLR